eukprot:Sspe_Gene.84497::Locus_55467_Transcript_1_2_Confidence_0.500_Length_1449::g.84497::m.84497/K09490/HSPA5, BIP; heat shock 70kDa protein 5
MGATDWACTLVVGIFVFPVVLSFLPWWELSREVHLGIDLGTTYSVATVCVAGKVRSVKVESSPLLPSVVGWNATAVYVGQDAVDMRVTNPKSVVYASKRYMGKGLEDPVVQEEMKELQYDLVEHNGKAAAKIEGREDPVLPQEVGSLILAKLKKAAEKEMGWQYYLGFRFTFAVVSVPVSFRGPQRHATQVAAQKAGFRLVSLIDEPVAAATAYGLNKDAKVKIVLVYDMGGGTLDIALLRPQSDTKTFYVIGTTGDPHLGGEDFDRHIAQYIKAQHPPPKALTGAEEASLLRNVERAKRLLSEQDTVQIATPWGTTVPFSLEDLEKSCEDLFERAMYPVDDALSLTPGMSGITVVLAGGSSRLIPIRRRLIDRFGKENVLSSLDADLAISMGAAQMGC